MLAVAAPLVAAAPASADGCAAGALVPVLRDVTANQGVGGYLRLARGKDTLFRAYLSLPSCAGTGDAIQVTGGQVTVTNAATGAVLTAVGPTPAPATVYPEVAPFAVAPLNDSPGDPIFLIPGSALAPAGVTTSFAAGFSVRIDYRAQTASGVVTTGSATFTPTSPSLSATPLTATVEQRTNALRLVVFPMGDASKSFSSQFSSAANAAVQNGMQTMSRVLPVPAGVGDLGSTGGIRYAINPSISVDLGAGGLNLLDSTGHFCGTGANFGPIGARLSTLLNSWNATHPTQTADRAVGAVDASTVALGTANGCALGMAAANSSSAWVEAIPTTSGPSRTGSLMTMETEHTWGDVPLARSDPNSPYHSPLTTADSPSPSYRTYNVSQRRYLADDHTVMALYGATWNDDTTLLERQDFAATLCVLGAVGGSGDCTSPGSVGTASGVQAGPVFVMAGTTDGTAGGTTVDEAYFSTDVAPSQADPSSPFFFVQRQGSTILNKEPITVSFVDSAHDGAGGTTVAPGTGVYRLAVPFNTSSTSIELWRGDPTQTGAVLLTRRTRGAAPTVTSASVAPASNWAPRRTPGTTPSAAAGAFLGGRFYVTHGESAGVATNAANAYDPTTDTWTSLPPAPLPRTEVTGVALNGKLYVLGGYANGNFAQPTGAVEVFDPKGGPLGSGAWSAAAPLNVPRWGMGAVALNGRIYAIGGSDGSTIQSTVEIFDPGAGNGLGSWTTGPPLQVARYEVPTITVLNGKIYVFGGATDAPGLPFTSSVEVFDPATNAWSFATPMPEARGDGIAGVCGGDAYVAGGVITTTPGNDVSTATVDRFDPAGNGGQGSWSPAPPLPAPIGDQAAGGVSDGSSLLSVGVDESGQAQASRFTCLPGNIVSATSTDADTAGSDQRADVILSCPNSTTFPLAAALKPAAANGNTATFTYDYDPERACASGTITVRTNDQFSQSAPATAGTLPAEDKRPIPAIAGPTPSTTFSQYSPIPLLGSATDPEESPSLAWSIPGLESTAVSGGSADLSPPANGWPTGHYVATLTASDSAGGGSTSVAFDIVADSDHDGMTVQKEGPTSGCFMPGADNDPFNAFALSANGIPNVDDPNPCRPMTGPYPGTGVMSPDTITIPDSTGTNGDRGIAITLQVRYRDLTQIAGQTVRLFRIAGADVSTDTRFMNTAWSATPGSAVARFSRTNLTTYLASRGITSGLVAVEVDGTSTAGWSFTSTATLLVTHAAGG